MESDMYLHTSIDDQRILDLMLQGRSAQELADALNRPVGAVEADMKRVLERFGADTPTRAFIEARRRSGQPVPDAWKQEASRLPGMVDGPLRMLIRALVAGATLDQLLATFSAADMDEALAVAVAAGAHHPLLDDKHLDIVRRALIEHRFEEVPEGDSRAILRALQVADWPSAMRVVVENGQLTRIPELETLAARLRRTGVDEREFTILHGRSLGATHQDLAGVLTCEEDTRTVLKPLQAGLGLDASVSAESAEAMLVYLWLSVDEPRPWDGTMLSVEEVVVLYLIALGHSEDEVAAQASAVLNTTLARADIREARNSLYATFDTESDPVLVARAAAAGVLTKIDSQLPLTAQLAREPLYTTDLKLLRLIALGKSIREAAVELEMNVGVAKAFVLVALQRLGIKSQTHLIYLAVVTNQLRVLSFDDFRLSTRRQLMPDFGDEPSPWAALRSAGQDVCVRAVRPRKAAVTSAVTPARSVPSPDATVVEEIGELYATIPPNAGFQEGSRCFPDDLESRIADNAAIVIAAARRGVLEPPDALSSKLRLMEGSPPGTVVGEALTALADGQQPSSLDGQAKNALKRLCASLGVRRPHAAVLLAIWARWIEPDDTTLEA
jgi:DNA-binding NarL/FixJ family response regulator